MKKFNEIGAGFSMLVPFLNTWYLYTTFKELEKTGIRGFINSTAVLIFGLIYNVIYVLFLLVWFCFAEIGVIYSALLIISFLCHIAVIVGGSITLAKINKFYQEQGIQNKTNSAMMMLIVVGAVLPFIIAIVFSLVTYNMALDILYSYDPSPLMGIGFMAIIVAIILMGCCVFAFYKFQQAINNFIDVYNNLLTYQTGYNQPYNQNPTVYPGQMY